MSAIQERGDQYKFQTFFFSAGAAGFAVRIVRSNRVAHKRPARWHSRNGPWTYECCFEVVYAYVDKPRNCN